MSITPEKYYLHLQKYLSLEEIFITAEKKFVNLFITSWEMFAISEKIFATSE